ncbi:MAG: hypothetical protein Tsb0033_15370 [Winogradskyella sp.]
MKLKIKLYSLLIISIIVCSCSSDDEETNNNTFDNRITVGSNTYELTNAYLELSELGNSAFYSIILTKGEIDYSTSPETYANEFELATVWSVRVPLTDTFLNSTTYNFDQDANSVRHLSAFGFSNEYQIVNNEIQSFNSVFNQNDIVDENARIIINELPNGSYNINFNAITTIGQVNGEFTGNLIHAN